MKLRGQHAGVMHTEVGKRELREVALIDVWLCEVLVREKTQL